jgi:hypothetical protein
MKLRILAIVLALAPLSVPGFAGTVRLTTDLSADLSPGAPSPQGTPTFMVGDQPVLWGFGWEIVPRKVGFGGDYMVSFSQDPVTGWWLDWFAPALFLGWHPLGSHRFVDPYAQFGVGSAGRVRLSGAPQTTADAGLSLSVFPFVGAGVNLNLDGLMIGARAIYTPFTMGIPATTIPAYPLGGLQVMVTAGVELGW